MPGDSDDIKFTLVSPNLINLPTASNIAPHLLETKDLFRLPPSLRQIPSF